MLRLIILVIAGYIIYRLFANDFFRKKKREEGEIKEEIEKKAAAGEMAQDPECGVYVEKESSISVRQGEKQFYFCSYECRDKFLAKLESGKNTPLQDK